ncbi:MAG: hypothetical protein ACMG6E_01325, partial [Candidatus Roizmanbacteria bacterium]
GDEGIKGIFSIFNCKFLFYYMSDRSYAISTSEDALTGYDLTPHIDTILTALSQKLSLPEGLDESAIAWRSKYSTGKLGAFNLKTELPDGTAVVVKVQGPQPGVAEEEMMRLFTQQNKSTKIRTPEILEFLRRSSLQDYDSIVMRDEEAAGAVDVIDHKSLTTAKEVDEFFDVIQEYRRHSLNKPWLEKPEEGAGYLEGFATWVKTRNPEAPAFTTAESEINEKVVALLDTRFRSKEPVFQHTHLSTHDIKKSPDGTYVLFSNLMWKYRWPSYDLTYAYSWYLLNIASFSEVEIKDQMTLWQGKIKAVAEELGEADDVEFAFLERTLAQVNFDVYFVPYEHREKMLSILRPFLQEQYERCKKLKTEN